MLKIRADSRPVCRAADNELERLALETRLIGANAAERVHQLAVLKAWQEASARDMPVDNAIAYVAAQAKIADEQQALSSSQSQFNADLRLTADLSQIVANQMSNAFGQVGSAIGDVISILGTYGDKQAEIDRAALAGSITQADAIVRTRALQVESYGSLAGAAKGLFREHSAGYQAMAAAEKAFAIIQLANTAVNLAAGASKMFATLGPWAFPAVAAMIAVMAGLGFSGSGGASGNYKAEDIQKAQGAGSVLGDSSAQSASLGHSLDLMAKNSNKDLEYSNETTRYLRSIDSNIGGLSSLLARQMGISSADNRVDGDRQQHHIRNRDGATGAGRPRRRHDRQGPRPRQASRRCLDRYRQDPGYRRTGQRHHESPVRHQDDDRASGPRCRILRRNAQRYLGRRYSRRELFAARDHQEEEAVRDLDGNLGRYE